MSESDIDRLFEEMTRARRWELDGAPARTAGRSAANGGPVEGGEPDHGTEPGRRAWLFGALGAVLALSLIATAFSLISRGASTVTADASGSTASVTTALAPTTTLTAAAVTGPDGSAAATGSNRPATGTLVAGGTPTTVPGTTVPTAPSTTVAAVTTATAKPLTGGPGEPTADNPSGTVRWLVVSERQLHLRGYSPNPLAATQSASLAGLLWGSPVVNELVMDPSTPVLGPAAVYIRDLVLFDTNSAFLKPEYSYILDAGVRLLLTYPGLRIRVISRADDTGNAADDLRLASARSQAVLDYAGRFGIPAAQFIPETGGASVASVDPGGARNRSVEFLVVGTVNV